MTNPVLLPEGMPAKSIAVTPTAVSPPGSRFPTAGDTVNQGKEEPAVKTMGAPPARRVHEGNGMSCVPIKSSWLCSRVIVMAHGPAPPHPKLAESNVGGGGGLVLPPPQA